MEDQRSRRDECQVEPIQKIPSADDLNEAYIARLDVQGMGCTNCGTRVRNSLLALDGVVSADVDWQSGLAFVDYVPTRTNTDALILAVAAAGNDGRHDYRAQIIP